MKAITKLLIVVLVLLGALIAYTITDQGGESPTPTTAVPIETAEDESPEDVGDGLHTAARTACREFLLQMLDRPDDAELDDHELWNVGQRPDGTLEVTIVGRIMDGLGERIDARWNCVIFPDAQQMRLVSLSMIDATADEGAMDAAGAEHTDPAPSPNPDATVESELPTDEDE